MIDVKAALDYLNNGLWNESMGAFREATSIEKYYQNDNTLARLVMRRYDPGKADVLTNGLLKDYTDPRWCILEGNVADFWPGPNVLPDWMRYADLIELEYLYRRFTNSRDFPDANELFGVLTKMYGLRYPGFMYDMATPKEACTMYKLLLFGMCAIRHNKMDLVRELLTKVSEFQLTPTNQDVIRNWREDEIGGIKTEYIPPGTEDQYTHLLVLANCETTSLAILLQDEYDARVIGDIIMVGAGIAAGATGVLAVSSFGKRK